MSITVDLAAQELAALKLLTHCESEAEAVVAAARGYLRISRLRELKAASGKLEFTPAWEELGGMEVNETFPH